MNELKIESLSAIQVLNASESPFYGEDLFEINLGVLNPHIKPLCYHTNQQENPGKAHHLTKPPPSKPFTDRMEPRITRSRKLQIQKEQRNIPIKRAVPDAAIHTSEEEVYIEEFVEDEQENKSTLKREHPRPEFNYLENLNLPRGQISKKGGQSRRQVDRSTMKPESYEYKSRKIQNQLGRLTAQFQSCVKIVGERRNHVYNDSQYCWKLGSVKKWMCLKEATEKAFGLYFQHMRKYKKQVQKSLKPAEKMKKLHNSSVKIKHGQDDLKHEPNKSEIVQNEWYNKQLKYLFNDILLQKLRNFNNNKSLKGNKETSNEAPIQINSDFELIDSSGSDYFPEAGQLKGFITDVIDGSNTKIQEKYQPRPENFKNNRVLENNLKKEEAGRERRKGRERQPLDTGIVEELNKFEEGVNYVGEVENLVGSLSHKYGNLECRDSLRSNNKVSEMSIEEYIIELVGSQTVNINSQSQGPPVIDLDSNVETTCKSEHHRR